jgi:hypothetical protein
MHLKVKPYFSSVQGTALVVIFDRFVVCFLNSISKSTVFVIQRDGSECTLISHFTFNVLQDYAVPNNMVSAGRPIDLPKNTEKARKEHFIKGMPIIFSIFKI